ncbi:MAG: MATE family efflux transporter [Eubacteriales bacterium]|nr:MATE family efflux transporter [Eubacteriales bacterium]
MSDTAAATENKMGTAPIGRLIISMSLPPVCSMFMQYSYNFVDSAFVARLGEKALTAVSLSFPVTSLMCSCSIGLGVGINVVIARSLGRKEQDKANEVVTLGILMAFVLGVLLNALTAVFMGGYFRSFTTDEEIYRLAMEYMSVCVFMQIPNMVHIAIQKVIQATGNMLAPMWFQIAGVVFNLVFDPILIFGIGPFPAMGIKGAALSTVLGFTFSMLLAFWVLLGTKQKVRMKIKGFRIDAAKMREIFSLGLPSFILNALNSFTVSFANLFLKPDMTAVAFFGAYFKAQHMIVMTVNGLIQGCLPIMSYNFGARKPDRLKKAFHCGMFGAAGLMTLGGILLFAVPVGVLALFDASEELLAIGIPAMRILVMGYTFNGLSMLIATYLQAIGRVKDSMAVNMTRQLLLLVPMMWLLRQFMGMTGIWAAFPVTELITLCMAYILLRNSRSYIDEKMSGEKI